MDSANASPVKVPWKKGKIVGQKAPLKLKDIWAIRIRLQLGNRVRELALFDLGLDSKLRACDLVRLRGKGHMQWRSSLNPCDSYAAKDIVAGSI